MNPMDNADAHSLRTKVHRQPWTNRLEIMLYSRIGAAVSYGTSLIMKTETEPGLEAMEPTFALHFEAAQELMDQLWMAGLRPTEGSGSAGSLAATERHLADMRSIVAKNLDVPFK